MSDFMEVRYADPDAQVSVLRLGIGKPQYRVMSCFSGISAASVAWKDDFEFVAFSEPAAFQSHVLHHRCGASRPKYLPEGFDPADYETLPESGVVNFGDISQITDDDLRKLGHVDVLEGGSPCQDFSVAGLRQGLDGTRGNLTLAFVMLAERMKRINGLKFVVWENVRGVLSDETNGFGNLLAALVGEWEQPLQPPRQGWSCAGHAVGPEGEVVWRTVQASSWGLAQRRDRVFAVAHFGTDVTGEAAGVLFESDDLPWRFEESKEKQNVVLDPGRRRSGAAGRRIEEEVAGEKVYALDMKSKPTASTTAYAITARNAGNPQLLIYKDSPDGGWIVRKMTPLETERLQGFPDDWTAVPFRKLQVAAAGHRRGAVGNSMPVPVMRFIGHFLHGRLSVLDAIERRNRAAALNPVAQNSGNRAAA
ncbi:DNA cytosine methyltransferase [Mesorhizobium sp. A623]